MWIHRVGDDRRSYSADSQSRTFLDGQNPRAAREHIPLSETTMKSRGTAGTSYLELRR